jgi:dienelactone hydrolase
MQSVELDRHVVIPEQDVRLEGILEIPASARGIVVFAHGSGSSRLSPRNQAVAAGLHEAGLGTLLFDLLTESETRDRANVFDISLLAARLIAATQWLEQEPGARGLRIGYFGASTGAAAALVAASRLGGRVDAVVSRGGRPDLAGASLPGVRAPTLLIVGGADQAVLGLNRLALERLECPKRLAIVPGATHLFEERGALEEVARLAQEWFVRYLAAVDGKAAGRESKGGSR